MSTDQDLKQELADVKRELSKLEGETICTYPEKHKRRIIKVSSDRGMLVQAEGKDRPAWIKWKDILRGYQYLHLQPNGEATNRKDGKVNPIAFGFQGAFIMPVLARLSTIELIKGRKPRTLRYIPEGLQVRLKPRGEWPCPKSSQS